MPTNPQTPAERAAAFFQKKQEEREAANRIHDIGSYGTAAIVQQQKSKIIGYTSIDAAIRANIERDIESLAKRRGMSVEQIKADLEKTEAAKFYKITPQGALYVMPREHMSDYQQQLAILKANIRSQETGKKEWYQPPAVQQQPQQETFFTKVSKVISPQAQEALQQTEYVMTKKAEAERRIIQIRQAAAEEILRREIAELPRDRRAEVLGEYEQFKEAIQQIPADYQINVTEETPEYTTWKLGARRYQRLENAISPIRPDKIYDYLMEPLYEYAEKTGATVSDELKILGKGTGWRLSLQRPKSSEELIIGAYGDFFPNLKKTTWRVTTPEEALLDKTLRTIREVKTEKEWEGKTQVGEYGISFASSTITAPVIAAGSFSGKALTKAFSDWGIGFGLVYPATEREVYERTGSREAASLAGLVTAGAYMGFTEILPKKIYTPKLVEVTAPTTEGKETPIWRGVSLEKAEKSIPIIGKTKAGIRIGTPKDIRIDLEPFAKTPKQLAGATETKIYRSNLPYTPIELEKFDLMVSEMAAGKGEYSAFLEKKGGWESSQRKLPESIPRLSEKGTTVTYEAIKKEGAELYGSVSSLPQMPKAEVAKQYGIELREPHDFDVQLGKDLKATEKWVQGLTTNIREAGADIVRVNPKEKTVIEAWQKTDAKWMKTHDIHAYDTGEGVPEKGLGFEFYRTPEKVSGVRLMALPESMLRKGSASMLVTEKGFYPEPHRIKDVGDFLNLRKTQILGEKMRGVDVSISEQRIGKLEKIWKSQKMLGFDIQPYKGESGSMMRPYRPIIEAGSIAASLSPILGSSAVKSVSYRKTSPSQSLIKSISQSISGSISPTSISQSISISPSQSISKSLSSSLSKSISPASISKSFSLSKSKPSSISQSVSAELRSLSISESSKSDSKNIEYTQPFSPNKYKQLRTPPILDFRLKMPSESSRKLIRGYKKPAVGQLPAYQDYQNMIKTLIGGEQKPVSRKKIKGKMKFWRII